MKKTEINIYNKLIEVLKEQIDFCDKKIEEFIHLRDSRKRVLEFYENRQKEVI